MACTRIKNGNIKEGYNKLREDYPYQGAIISNYSKKISTPTIKSEVQVLLSFKNTKTPPGKYRNLGISVSNLNYDDIPEINNEIYRMENILYRKLVEIAGRENVKRGEKEIYSR